MITALQFCPAPNKGGVLVSTGGDACVSFWTYTKKNYEVKFNPKPLKLNEKVRPGHSQLICASFSSGGNFLSVGGADHFVRVYKLGGPEGVEKLIETEIHSDRVDSIQWCHSGLKFVSGSRDGTALIWRYECQQWKTTTLNMKQNLTGVTPSEEDTKKLQVTMVGWDRTDTLVITASSDHLLRVWDSQTGVLKTVLCGHEDNAYVIEAHPTDNRLILTAGHDGLLIIWDVIAGSAVKSFKNSIEGQGHGALFDAKWSPDGLSIATTDSHGHILIFGIGHNELFKKIPQELFFHTDYRPLVRDVNHHVLDEQTQLAPHLMPPPFLVNIDGDPYPPEFQRLVPGREKCRMDQLIPNVVTNDNGEQEVLDLAMVDLEPPPPPSVRVPNEEELNGAGGRPNIDDMIARLAQEQVGRRSGELEQGWDEEPGPSGAGGVDRRGSTSGGGPHPDHSYAVAAGYDALSPRAGRVGARREGDIEGVRQSTGNWQRDPHMKWKRQLFLAPLTDGSLEQSRMVRKCKGDMELAIYEEESKKKPEVIPTKEDEEGERESKRYRRRQKKTHAYSTRANRGEPRRSSGTSRATGRRPAGSRLPTAQSTFGADFEDPDAAIASQEREQEEEEEEAALSSSSSSSSSSVAKEALEEEESSSDDSDNSTDYSDWTADFGGAGLEPPKRTAHKQKKNPVPVKRKRRRAKKEEGEAEESEDEVEVKEEKEEKKVRRERRKRGEKEEEKEKRPSNARRKRDARNLNMAESDMEIDEIPPEFRPPEWLGETVPKKAPYFPQMGDEIMYFRQGHQLYVEAVINRSLYPIDKRSLPWIRKHNLRDQEFVKIIGMKYEIKPPRLCCLKLGIMDLDGVLTGDSFTIKYHDMPDVLDFLVLKNTYDAAVSRNWKPGDRFRCIIDDAWWVGSVESQEPHLPEFPDSMFMCYRVLWDNGERERLSPWDMEFIDEQMELPDIGGSVQVCPEEYKNLVYTPSPEDWAGSSFESECQRMAEGIGKIMELAAAEPFLAPVDLNIYPNYAMIIEYHMDLSTIKSRLESHFYRRPNAAQFDVRYIATNAEKFNKKGSVIVKHARIITDLSLRLIKDPTCRDPTQYYHEVQNNYQSPSHSEDETSRRDKPDSEEEKTRRRTSGRMRESSARPGRDGTIVLPKKVVDDRPWQQQCRDLLKSMFERQDSTPFRFPVDVNRYEDYYQVIDVPMDLSTIREELSAGGYASPHDFAKDVRLVFQNSKNYNTNNKSRIYSMTVRLEAFFEDQIKRIFARCKQRGKGKRTARKGPIRKPRGPPDKPSEPSTNLAHHLGVRSCRGVFAALQPKKDALNSAHMAGPSGSGTDSLRLRLNGRRDYDESDDDGDDGENDALRGSVNEGGKRRSRRVAKLRQLKTNDSDSDSDDEEYSPLKKNPQKSHVRPSGRGGKEIHPAPVRSSESPSTTTTREKGGPVKRTVPVRRPRNDSDDSDFEVEITSARTPLSVPSLRPKKTRRYDEDSDIESKAPSLPPALDSSSEEDEKEPGRSNEAPSVVQRPSRAIAKKYIKSESSSENEEEEEEDIMKQNGKGGHIVGASKRRIESSNEEDEEVVEEALVNGVKEEKNWRVVKEEEEEDEDEEDKCNEDEEEDEVDDEESEEEEEVEEEETKKKKVSSERSQRLTLASFGGRKPLEESEFECDDEDFDDESEEEEEEGGKKKKTRRGGRTGARRIRPKAVDGDDIEEDVDFVAADFIDDNEESKTSSSSSSSDSDDESNGRRKKKKPKKRKLTEKEIQKKKEQTRKERSKRAKAMAREKAKAAKAKAKAREKAKKERQRAREKEKARKAKEAEKEKKKMESPAKGGKGSRRKSQDQTVALNTRVSVTPSVTAQLHHSTAGIHQSPNMIHQIHQASPMASQVHINPQMHHSSVNPQMHQDTLGTQILHTPISTQIHHRPIRPQMHQSPIRSQIHQSPIRSQIHQSPIRSQIHQSPIRHQIHQSPIRPQIHQSPIRSQLHQSPIRSQIHQSPVSYQAQVAPQIHQSPVGSQMYHSPIRSQMYEGTAVAPQPHYSSAPPRFQATPVVQQQYLIPVSTTYSTMPSYVPIAPNPHHSTASQPPPHSFMSSPNSTQIPLSFDSRTQARQVFHGGRIIGTKITQIAPVTEASTGTISRSPEEAGTGSSASVSEDDDDDFEPGTSYAANGSWNNRSRTRRGLIGDSDEDEVGKRGRVRKRVRYNEEDDSEEGEASNSVSSRGRVRKANTRMRDFI